MTEQQKLELIAKLEEDFQKVKDVFNKELQFIFDKTWGDLYIKVDEAKSKKKKNRSEIKKLEDEIKFLEDLRDLKREKFEKDMDKFEYEMNKLKNE